MLDMGYDEIIPQAAIVMLALTFIYPCYVMMRTLVECYKLAKEKLKKVERRTKRLKAQEMYLCHKLRDEVENRYRRSIIAATLRTTIEEVKAAELKQIQDTFSRDGVLQEAQVNKETTVESRLYVINGPAKGWIIKNESSILDPLMNRFTPTFQPLPNQFNPGLKNSAVFGTQENFTYGINNFMKSKTTITQTKTCKTEGQKSKKYYPNVRKKKHSQHKLNKPVLKQMIKSSLTELKCPRETKGNSDFERNVQQSYFNHKSQLKMPTLKTNKKNGPDHRSLTCPVQSFTAISSKAKHTFQNCKQSFSDFNIGNVKENDKKLYIKKRYQHSCSNQLSFNPILHDSKINPTYKDTDQFLNVKMNLVQSNGKCNQSLYEVRSETSCGIQVDLVRSKQDFKEFVSEKLIVKSGKNKTVMIQNIIEEMLKPVNFKRCHICINSNFIGFGKLSTRAFKIVVKLKKAIVLLKFNLYFITKRRKGSSRNLYLKSKLKGNAVKNPMDEKSSKNSLITRYNYINEKFHKKRNNLLTYNIRQNDNTYDSNYEKSMEVEQLAEGDFNSVNQARMMSLKQLLFNQSQEKDDIQATLNSYTEEEINKAILKQCIGLSKDGFMDAVTFREHIPEIMYYLKNERTLSTILEEPSEESNELYHKGTKATESTKASMINKSAEEKCSEKDNDPPDLEIVTCKISNVSNDRESVITLFDENEAFDLISSSEEQMLGSEHSVTSDQEVFTDNPPVKDFTVRLTSSKRNMLLYLEDKKLLSLGKFSGNNTLDLLETPDKVPNCSLNSERRTLLSETNHLDLQALFQNKESLFEQEEMQIAKSQSDIPNVFFSQSTPENFNDFSHFNNDCLKSLQLLFDMKRLSEKCIDTPINRFLLAVETQDDRNGCSRPIENPKLEMGLGNSNNQIEFPKVKKSDSIVCCDDAKEENEVYVERIHAGSSVYMSKTLIIRKDEFHNGNPSNEIPTIAVEGVLIGTILDEMGIFEQHFPNLLENVENFEENNNVLEVENCQNSEDNEKIKSVLDG